MRSNMGTSQSPETRDNCPLQIGKTKGISRPLLLCGLNQWIAGRREVFPPTWSVEELDAA